jgi:hypothetical protein
MKKVPLAALCGLFLQAVSAVEAQFSVTISGSGVTIDGYTGPGGVVAIPATISNLPVTTIGTRAFYGISNLTGVTIPNGVTAIGENAFGLCPALVDVTVPSSVASIGEDVFSQCAGLTNVTMTNGLTSIGVGAFSECTLLGSVAIPGSVTNIGLEAFLGCTSLEAINVDPQNGSYTSAAGVLFDNNQTTLIAYPCAIGGKYAVPGGVKNIETYAFFESFDLASVIIPASVTNLADFAFYYCPSMTNVFFAGDAPSLGSSVFLSDDGATAYYLPGKAGWGSQYDALTAVLWNPQIEASGIGAGAQGNLFEFDISGSANIPIVVESCGDLTGNVWTPVLATTLTNSLYHFNQAVQTGTDNMYFRIRSP